jgi:hypothetical protein
LMSKWYVVAKAEYRVLTSPIRRLRAVIPPIALIAVPILAFFVTTQVIKTVLDEFLLFILSIVAIGVIKLVLLMIFLMFIFFPIGQMLKSEQTEQLETFLSAPVRPGDILLGRFLGTMPIYSIAVATIAAIFAALFEPLGLDPIQYALFVIVFVLTPFSGLWIGVSSASILRTKLSTSVKGKDIGKAISMLVGLPMVAIMYALMGGGLAGALADPGTNSTVNAILNIFPSSWGGDLMMDFAKHPGDLGAIWPMTIIRFGGVVLFFVASLYVGMKVAVKNYRIEAFTFQSSMAGPDGMFYRTVRAIGGGGSSGALLVAMFKDYVRRLQNLSNLTFMVGVLVLLNIFFGDLDDPFAIVMMSTIIFAMMAGLVMGEVTVRGKENLFIYRKSPHGEERLVGARLTQGWLVSVPIAAVFMAVTVTLLHFPWVQALIMVIYITIVMAAFVVAALGLYLWKPTFSDKPADMMVNAMMLNIVAIFSLIGLVEGLDDEWYAIAAMMPFSWVIAAVFLSVGLENLKRIE